MIKVVLFDLGGGRNSAFARLERNELTFKEFDKKFAEECSKEGAYISGEDFIKAIEERTTRAPNPLMIHSIKMIRSKGLKTGAITNNWFHFTKDKTDTTAMETFRSLFDVFLESRVLGISKPDPRIYKMAVEQLGVKFEECVFLDDIGSNLKAAKELGMKTIKVSNPRQALIELQALLGFSLQLPPSSSPKL